MWRAQLDSIASRTAPPEGAARQSAPGQALAIRMVVGTFAPWLAVAWFVGGAALSQAHDSPEHVIEGLTARLEIQGGRADLWWRRATEYRALGRYEEAARDLGRALKLQRDFMPALEDLCRVQLAQGSLTAALGTVDRALKLVPGEGGRAGLRMLRAEVLARKGDCRKALAECDLALRHAPVQETEWYLTRSEIQCQLGLYQEAAAGLRQGFESTGSAVIEVEWIDAMIDAGAFADAASRLGPWLADSRWVGSWRVRRARIRLGQGDVAAAHEDLLAAIGEFNKRLGGLHPDPGLLADRGLAYALLGDRELARRDLRSARQLGAEDRTLRRVELSMAQAAR